MAINAAEEETLESLKKWWEENGKQLIAMVVVVALGFGGFNFWESQQLATQGAASDLYEEILELTLVEPGEQVDGAAIIRLSDQLRADFAATSYASFGALFAAQQHVAANDLAAAETALQWIIDNYDGGLFGETDEGLLLTANLRLGRVMLARGDAERALALVNSVDPKTFEAGYTELRGDVYLALGRSADARDAYLAAQEAGSQSEALRMKLDNLARTDS
ncbi:MAG: tetratricopeptide repeat protein [Gammaproteobacteria bacterium]|nr:tetratricopeptide repeat protein [Gammaproteobacteria bacterium]